MNEAERQKLEIEQEAWRSIDAMTENLREKVLKQNKELVEKEKTISEKDKSISEKDKTISDKDKLIEELMRKLNEKK